MRLYGVFVEWSASMSDSAAKCSVFGVEQRGHDASCREEHVTHCVANRSEANLDEPEGTVNCRACSKMRNKQDKRDYPDQVPSPIITAQLLLSQYG